MSLSARKAGTKTGPWSFHEVFLIDTPLVRNLIPIKLDNLVLDLCLLGGKLIARLTSDY